MENKEKPKDILKRKLIEFKTKFLNIVQKEKSKYESLSPSNRFLYVIFVLVVLDLLIISNIIPLINNYIKKDYVVINMNKIKDENDKKIIASDSLDLYFDANKQNINNITITHNAQNEINNIVSVVIYLNNKNNNEQEKIYLFNNIHVNSIVNFEKKLIENKIKYSWQSKQQDKRIVLNSDQTFFIINLIFKNLFDIFLIYFFIFLLEKQGMFGNKEKYKVIHGRNISNVDNLIGLDTIKEEILQIADLINNRDKFKTFGIDKTFNILFSGAPGTGKTKIVSLLAKELNVPVIIGTGNIETGFINGGSAVLKEIFEKAKSLAIQDDSRLCIVFLDEAQNLLMKRGQSREKYADDSSNELLALLDGVHTNDDKKYDIVFIAASNFDDKNHSFDEAMMRRFQKKIFFPMPNKENRKKIFELYLNRINYENKEHIDYDYLSEITTNLSPALIENIVKESALLAIQHKEKINTKTLEKAFEKIYIGTPIRKINEEQKETRNTIALHELGHFICEYQLVMNRIKKENVVYDYNLYKDNTKEEYIKILLKKINTLKISIEQVEQINVLGYVLNKQKEFELKTKKDLEEEIICLYGGIAAEKVFFNDDDLITIGSYNDIEKVSGIFNTMVNKLGMYNEFSKINLNLIDNIDVSEKNQEIVLKQSEIMFSRSQDIIKENKELIEYLLKYLLSKYTLSINEALELIYNYNNKE
jgi:cell division protease FtsH